MSRHGFSRLHHRVLETDACSRCGACGPACPEEVIALEGGRPRLVGKCAPDCHVCFDVCPETGSNGPILAEAAKRRLPTIERYVGRIRPTELLEQTGSGGLTSAVAISLLERKVVDAVVVTELGGDRPWEARPALAYDRAAVLHASRPKYALAPNLRVLGEIADAGLSSVAIVALPCQIEALVQMRFHAARLPARTRRGLDAIRFVIGLWCGLNCTAEGTAEFIRELGINPDEVERVGYERADGQAYFVAETPRGKRVAHLRQYMGYLFANHAAPACRACTRWHSEHADLSVGGLDQPGLKWSGVLVQTAAGQRMLREAIVHGMLELAPMPREEVERLRRKDHRKTTFKQSAPR